MLVDGVPGPKSWFVQLDLSGVITIGMMTMEMIAIFPMTSIQKTLAPHWLNAIPGPRYNSRFVWLNLSGVITVPGDNSNNNGDIAIYH